jgi:hypothetical protein
MNQGVALNLTAACLPAGASAQAGGGASLMHPEGGRPRPQQRRDPSRALSMNPAQPQQVHGRNARSKFGVAHLWTQTENCCYPPLQASRPRRYCVGEGAAPASCTKSATSSAGVQVLPT